MLQPWERGSSEANGSVKKLEWRGTCLDGSSSLNIRTTLTGVEVAAEYFINWSVEKESVYLLTPAAWAMIYFSRGARARRAAISIQIKTVASFVTNKHRYVGDTFRPAPPPDSRDLMKARFAVRLNYSNAFGAAPLSNTGGRNWMSASDVLKSPRSQRRNLTGSWVRRRLRWNLTHAFDCLAAVSAWACGCARVPVYVYLQVPACVGLFVAREYALAGIRHARTSELNMF